MKTQKHIINQASQRAQEAISGAAFDVNEILAFQNQLQQADQKQFAHHFAIELGEYTAHVVSQGDGRTTYVLPRFVEACVDLSEQNLILAVETLKKNLARCPALSQKANPVGDEREITHEAEKDIYAFFHQHPKYTAQQLVIVVDVLSTSMQRTQHHGRMRERKADK